MKALNTTKFIVNMTEEIAEYKASIKAADTYEAAKIIANRMLGYIDCSITFLNTMICMENNDFTEEFDAVVDEWHYSMFQLMADKAIDTKQSNKLIWRLLQRRDEYAA